MTSHDPTWPEVTRKRRHFTAIHLEWLRRPKTHVWVRLSSYRAITRRRWHSHDRKCCQWPHVTVSDPEVTSIHRKLPGSGCRRPKTRVLGTFDILQGCNSQVAVTWQEMTSRDPTWPKLTQEWPHFTGSHRQVAVEGRKLVLEYFWASTGL